MPVTLGPSAAALKSKGLDLEKLSEEQKKTLAGSDGVIDNSEAASIQRFTDTNNDGFVDPREAARLGQTVLAEGQGVVPDDFGGQKLDARAAALRTELEPKFATAFRAEDDARARLSARDIPTRPLAELQAQRAKLPGPAQLEAAKADVQSRRGELTQLSAQYRLAEGKLTAAKAELAAAMPDANHARSSQPVFQNEASRQEAMLHLMPTPEARAEHVAELKSKLRKFDAELERYGGVERAPIDKLKVRTELEREIVVAQSFDPQDARRAIASLGTNAESKNPALAREANAQSAVNAATAELSKLREAIAATNAKVIAGEQHVRTIAPGAQKAELLDRQIAFLQAQETVSNLRSQNGALITLGESAAKQTERAALVKQGNQQLVTTVPQLVGEMQEHRQSGMNMAFKLKELKQLHQLKADVAAGKLKGKDIDLQKVDAWIASTTSGAQQLGRQMEATAGKIARQLDDPAFQAAIAQLPPEKAGEVLRDLTASLHGTQTGARYFARNIKPALEGNPRAPQFWTRMYNAADPATPAEEPSTVYIPAKQVSEHAKRALSILEGVGGFVAEQKDASAALDQALRTGLGLKKLSGNYNVDDIESLREAAVLCKGGDKKAAQELLKSRGLGRFANNVEHFTKSVGGVASLLTVGEFVRDPTVRNCIDAAGNSAELVQLATSFAAKGSSWAKFGTRVGNAAPLLSAVVGVMDMDTAAKRGDQASTIGNALIATGGVVATAGLIADGTVVGAVVGVPLNVIGGAMALTGGLVEAVWGDSDTEKHLKEQDLWVMSRAYSDSVK